MTLDQDLKSLGKAKRAATMPPVLEAILLALQDQPQIQELLIEQLKGNESAEELAGVLTAHGYQVSASTIRAYRRSLRRAST